MDELDKIYEKLESLENLYGYTGVGIGIFILIIGFLSWKYLTSYAENYAKSFFNQSLAQFQANLVQIIGEKLITQRGEIEKEITGLKGELEKELSLVQSNLGLITGQQTNFLNERRKSLTDLYTSHVDWTNTVLDKSAFDIDEDNLNLRREMVDEMNKVKHRFNITSASYQIYGRDESLNEIMKELLMGTAKLQVLKEKQLFQVELILKERIQINKRLDNAIANNPEQYKTLRAELKENSEKLIAKKQELEEELLEMYKEITLNQTKATARISELIKETYENKNE